ncbi:MAG TPA: DUF2330 domain-containing protein, partial [Xanthomonadales bacterium]|nr:DUF2330 domain-containing protein [Xanthomonadales bacterium]
MRRIGVLAAAILATTTTSAHAFCGFYVSGSEKKMFNDATNVVLMREGTRTVLSMQNDYKGPLQDFAMVVPVPVVLKKEEVKTLPRYVFDRIDQLGAPRLVEYWEQDPCPRPYHYRDEDIAAGAAPTMAESSVADRPSARKQTVKIEAKFEVGEYQILILSATEAAGLERWLNDNRYKIPPGAEPLLRPYVEAGSKFIVAKVDPKKVKMEGDRAALSPLRFHYDSEEFSLPIRLGMANSSGKQDLIVNIVAADQRYEVANYKNVVIPTNFDVKPNVKTRFAEFYAALFDKTVEANPGAVVTEYAWTAMPNMGKCDPCPPEPPVDADMMTLGGDIVGGKIAQGYYVLTRLHARYGRSDMKDDLRFKVGKPITGGREVWSKQGLEYGAQPATANYFQARYAIRYWWTGPIKCANPRRGVWGGPPDGNFG